MRVLLAAGTDPSLMSLTSSGDGITPINVACAKGHVDVVKVLISGGEDLALGDKNGCTPLFASASFGHAEVVN